MVREGYSENEVPPEFGESKPYYKKALMVTLPAALITPLVAMLAPAPVSRVLAQLGASYSFGSNLWLLIYGPRMFRVCKGVPWLGVEGFSTIQASLFPDFFAFQTAGCAMALGARLAATNCRDLAVIAIAASLAFGLVNQCLLGPKTNKLMVELYSKELMDDARKQTKKRFGMVHGTSMLLDLFALAGVAAYLVLLAA